jgi:hypothetical protein
VGGERREEEGACPRVARGGNAALGGVSSEMLGREQQRRVRMKEMMAAMIIVRMDFGRMGVCVCVCCAWWLIEE